MNSRLLERDAEWFAKDGFEMWMARQADVPAIREAQRAEDVGVLGVAFVVLCCWLLLAGIAIGLWLR